MLFNNITLIDEDIRVRENMYVGTKGAYIDYVGEEKPQEDYGEVYEAKTSFSWPALSMPMPIHL